MSVNSYFYTGDHLGSTSLVLDGDGNISQSVSYIPYGEIFVEERNGAWNSPYLFNAKALDEETGFYYYGARYLNPTSAVWLSVDPLWEKNIDASPYSYCHGNPVMKVDVMGLDDYGVDDNGYIFFIKKTEREKDRLIAGVRRRKNGEIKGFRYNEDGKLKNESIDVSKGVFTERSIRKSIYKTGHQFTLLNKDESESLFKFLADNTKVEWGLFNYYKKGVDNSERFILGTSHEWNKEGVTTTSLKMILKEEHVLFNFHYHSHPRDYKVSEQENIDPSWKDIDFSNQLKNFINTITTSNLKFI